MTPEQITEKIGSPVSQSEMVDMLRSNPIGTAPGDAKIRSGALSFSFGPSGVILEAAEIRKPLRSGE